MSNTTRNFNGMEREVQQKLTDAATLTPESPPTVILSNENEGLGFAVTLPDATECEGKILHLERDEIRSLAVDDYTIATGNTSLQDFSEGSFNPAGNRFYMTVPGVGYYTYNLDTQSASLTSSATVERDISRVSDGVYIKTTGGYISITTSGGTGAGSGLWTAGRFAAAYNKVHLFCAPTTGGLNRNGTTFSNETRTFGALAVSNTECVAILSDGSELRYISRSALSTATTSLWLTAEPGEIFNEVASFNGLVVVYSFSAAGDVIRLYDEFHNFLASYTDTPVGVGAPTTNVNITVYDEDIYFTSRSGGAGNNDPCIKRLYRHGSQLLLRETISTQYLAGASERLDNTVRRIVGFYPNGSSIDQATFFDYNPLTTDQTIEVVPEAGQTIDSLSTVELKYASDSISLIALQGNWYILESKFGVGPTQTLAGGQQGGERVPLHYRDLAVSDIPALGYVEYNVPILLAAANPSYSQARVLEARPSLILDSNIELGLNDNMPQWSNQPHPETGVSTRSNIGTAVTPTANGASTLIISPTDTRLTAYGGSSPYCGLTPSNFVHIKKEWGPIWSCVFVPRETNLDSGQGGRWDVGLVTVNSLPTTAPAIATRSRPTGACAAFTAWDATSVNREVWECITGDGVTQQITATAVDLVAATAYRFTIDQSDPSVVRFYIDGELVAEHETNIPPSSTTWGWIAAASVEVSVGVGRVTCRYGAS
jgi:hypothetical protein